jgi:hypothetical protein
LAGETTMLTAEECSRLAEECEQDAALASSPKVCKEMLEAARMWRDLADFKQQMRSVEASHMLKGKQGTEHGKSKIEQRRNSPGP